MKIIGVFSDNLGFILHKTVLMYSNCFPFNRNITKNGIGENICVIKKKLKPQINTQIHYSPGFISDDDIWFHSDGN